MTGITIDLLAERPELIPGVGRMRWREWGRPPEPEDPDWWIDVTRREAGRDELPVTYVAVCGGDEPLGAVGLGQFDIAERRDRSPWVLGMIVRVDQRGIGIGRRLMNRLERHAAALGYSTVWVATGDAVGFYGRCGYQLAETVSLGSGTTADVLAKQL